MNHPNPLILTITVSKGVVHSLKAILLLTWTMRKTTVRAISRALGVILLLTLGTWGVGQVYHEVISTTDLGDPDEPVDRDLRQGLNSPVIRADLDFGGGRRTKRSDFSAVQFFRRSNLTRGMDGRMKITNRNGVLVARRPPIIGTGKQGIRTKVGVDAGALARSNRGGVVWSTKNTLRQPAREFRVHKPSAPPKVSRPGDVLYTAGVSSTGVSDVTTDATLVDLTTQGTAHDVLENKDTTVHQVEPSVKELYQRRDETTGSETDSLCDHDRRGPFEWSRPDKWFQGLENFFRESDLREVIIVSALVGLLACGSVLGAANQAYLLYRRKKWARRFGKAYRTKTRSGGMKAAIVKGLSSLREGLCRKHSYKPVTPSSPTVWRGEDLNSRDSQTPVRPLKREDLSFFSSESFRHLPTYRDLNQLAGEADWRPTYATLGGYQRGVNARVEGYNSCRKQLLTFAGDQGDGRMCCSVNLLEETGRRADNLNRDLAEDVREGFGLDPVPRVEEALEEVIVEAHVHESG